MKNRIIALLCAVLALSLAACGGAASDVSAPDASVSDASAPDASASQANAGAQLANPFTDCESLEEARKLAGFDITVPDSFPDAGSRRFRAIEGSLLEILYLDGEEVVVRVRKAPGEQDISGDFTQYSQTAAIREGDREILVKGNDDLAMLATWTQDGYSYGVSVPGLPYEQLTQWIAGIQ